MQKLLGRLTVAMPSEPEPWRLYGLLLTEGWEADQQSLVTGAKNYQRSVASITAHRGWEKVKQTCIDVLVCAKSWIEVVHRVEKSQQLQLYTSLKFSLNSVVKLVEKNQEDVTTGELSEDLLEVLNPVRIGLEQIVVKIAELKA